MTLDRRRARRSGRMVAMAMAVVAVAAVSVTEAMARSAPQRYTVELRTPGLPVVPYLPVGVRACSAPTICDEVYPDYETGGGRYVLMFERGETRTLVPYIVMPSGREITGSSRRVTAGSDRDLGRVSVTYPRPIGKVAVDVSMIDAKQSHWPFALFCPVGVPVEQECEGGTELVLRKNGGDTLRVAVGDWTLTTGYYRYDSHGEAGVSQEFIKSTTRSIVVRDGISQSVSDSVRIKPRGTLRITAKVSQRQGVGFFEQGYGAGVAVELCRDVSCGVRMRIYVPATGTQQIDLPVTEGAWTMRSWLEDDCQSVFERAPRDEVTIRAGQTVRRTVDFTVTGIPNPDGC